MDISVFKASRSRLMIWIVGPPLVIVTLGLGSHALRLQSVWELNRTKKLVEVLPKLVQTKQHSNELLTEFRKGSGEEGIESEDQFISFLQEVAQHVGFTVDSIKVERRIATASANMQVLSAVVKGTGSFDIVDLYLDDVISAHQLLSENTIKLSQVKEYNIDFYRAELAFELLLYNSSKVAGGSVKQ